MIIRNFLWLSLLIFAFACAVGFWRAHRQVQNQMLLQKHDLARSAEQSGYVDLYRWQLVANAVTYTALLQRLDRGDSETVKRVLFKELETDLSRINLQTNYLWSEDQKKSIAYAEVYMRSILIRKAQP